MQIDNLTKENIISAIEYIDENGVPFHNQSTRYELVAEDGKKYPPKYVVAVAKSIVTSEEISTADFNSIEARGFLEKLGFVIETKQQVIYELHITADSVASTDEHFTMDNLSLGNDFEPTDAYFEKANGEIVKRDRQKREHKISNQTLPKLAFQIFEEQIAALPAEERAGFPICKYNSDDKMRYGIYLTEEELKEHITSLEYVTYINHNRVFYIYCWNIFSTIIFVQECLRKFGQAGDKFVLQYTEKAADSDSDWFPAIADYNPELTVDDWKSLLADSSVFTTGSLQIMKRMMDYGGQATCTQLSEKYGEAKNFYLTGSHTLGIRIADKTNCPILKKDNDNAKWCTILYVGRKADRDEKGSYVWKLRGELSQALEQIDMSNIELYANKQVPMYQIPYSEVLLESGNVIFHGAPGTGKSYLAKQIAADIVTDGATYNYGALTDEQKSQVEFVQFHPSYDYTDFVEGLRPKIGTDGSAQFELQDGIFKRFITRARKNYENSQKTVEIIAKELSVQEAINAFLDSIEFGTTMFKTINGNEFTITDVDDKYIYISIPHNETVNKLALYIDEIKKILESDQKFNKIKDITSFFGKKFATQQFSYDFILYKEIKKHKVSKVKTKQTEQKKYIFIIDEINRGEISKIFGELFYSIDPTCRGKVGEISTQYTNMHDDPSEKFYIPENVYSIGTMNDIDRSVDSFDFAMRRRFRFIQLRADECVQMLDSLEETKKSEAIIRMNALNKAIDEVEDLNENYHIGAAYFLKVRSMSFDKLWEDYLEPLLQEYVQGMYDEKKLMQDFAKAYGYRVPVTGNTNDDNQG